MKGGKVARCARKLTAVGMLAPAQTRPMCNNPAICKRMVNVRIVMLFLSNGADGIEHRQNYISNKGWMKEPKCGTCSHEEGESPSSPAVPQSQRASGFAALDQDGQPLQKEIERGQSVTAAGREGDREIMNEPGNQEGAHGGSRNANRSSQSPENKLIRQLIEGRIPTLTPKVRKRSCRQWLAHHGGDPQALLLPCQGQQLEQSKVQRENDTRHPKPASQNRCNSGRSMSCHKDKERPNNRR